jgi:hypothetical protein
VGGSSPLENWLASLDMSTLLEASPKSPADKVTAIKVIAAALMLAVGVAILAYAMDSTDAAKRDYMCYWAAAQQMVHGKTLTTAQP